MCPAGPPLAPRRSPSSAAAATVGNLQRIIVLLPALVQRFQNLNHIGRHAVGWAKLPGNAIMVARRWAIITPVPGNFAHPTLIGHGIDPLARSAGALRSIN